MRVIHFIGTNFVGGPEKQILNHLPRLAASGHAVLLVSFAEPGGEALARAAAAQRVRCELLAPGKWQLGAVMAGLRRLHREWAPDVVCAHGYKAGFYALWLRLLTGCPCIAFSRGWTSENLKVRMYGWLDKALVRFADRVVAVSQAQRRRLERVLVPVRKIRVVENAVTFAPEDAGAAVETASVRAELGIAAQAPLILAAGRLSPEKGCRYLLAAVDGILARFPEARVLIAGDGPDEAMLRAQAARLQGAAHVHFLGFRNDMRRLLRQADVLALPSLSEGLPNVVLEAMASGLPVVATRVGGVPELVQDGVTGLLVEPRQPAALAQAIVRLLDDRALAGKLAQQARTMVHERYSAERQTQQLLGVYAEVAHA